MKYVYIAAIPLLNLMPIFFANAQPSATCNPSTPNFPACAGPQSPGLQYSIRSPLSGINSIEGLLTAILNILLIIAVPIIIFFVIFAGFNYVTAQGNPEKIKTASRSLTYALIGAVLILGAVALSEIITGIINSLGT